MDRYADCYYRFIAGDEDAFAELLETFGEKLIAFIYRFVDNYALAEDLMQDAFCELLIHKKRFHGKSSFQTYLFAIARNKAVDAIRKNIRQREAFEQAVPWSDDEIAMIEERMYSRQRGAALHKAMSQLNVDYRTALHLVYFEEMSYDEAAGVLKKNSRQIKNMVYRAK